MTHQDIDYSKEAAPHHKAIEDIKEYLGDSYDDLYKHLKNMKDPRSWALGCDIIGIQGFPVKAWYDLAHGEGAYDKAWDKIEADEAAAQSQS